MKNDSEEKNTEGDTKHNQIANMAIFDFEFTWEKKEFDIKDKDCKKNTYWYDPIEFNRILSLHMKKTLGVFSLLPIGEMKQLK